MIQIHQPANDETTGVSKRPRPSRQLLKRIVVGGGHSIGQRVLVIGPGCDELIDCLTSLGFDVDSSGKAPLEWAARESNRPTFDLMLVDASDHHRGSLLDPSLRLVTAQLLSHLNPGGDFVVIRDASCGPIPGASVGTLHDAACWTRHLACFPGQLEATEFPAPWVSRSTWHWLMGRGSAPAIETVSLKIPTERMSVEQWQDHARRGLLTGATCCAAVRPLHSQRDAA